jgi:hypothetical protein
VLAVGPGFASMAYTISNGKPIPHSTVIISACFIVIEIAIVSTIIALVTVCLMGEKQTTAVVATTGHDLVFLEPTSRSQLDIWADAVIEAVKNGPPEWPKRKAPSLRELYPPNAKRLFPVL